MNEPPVSILRQMLHKAGISVSTESLPVKKDEVPASKKIALSSWEEVIDSLITK